MPDILLPGKLPVKTPNPVSLEAIDFFPWRWIDAPFALETDAIKALTGFGFKHSLKYSHLNKDSWRRSLNGVKIMGLRKNTLFLMDGIVIKSSNMKDRGNTESNSNNPDWAIAWKFPAKTATTTVVDIAFSKGKSGKVTPVVIVSPVTVEGRVIRRVSLGSIQHYCEKDIAIGDQVSVMLKGSATPVLGQVIFRNVERQKPEIKIINRLK